MEQMEIPSSEVQRRATETLRARGIRETVTRAVLARLRSQYVEIQPTRRVGAGLMLWPPDAPERVAAIIEREVAERR